MSEVHNQNKTDAEKRKLEEVRLQEVSYSQIGKTLRIMIL